MDRYELGESIGEGAFGIVFLAYKKDTNIKRAIKRIKKQSTWEGLRNMRELRSLLSLPPHPNIIQLLEVIREDSLIHFVFELIPGGSLKEVISHRNEHSMPPLGHDDTLLILQQVLSGVKHMHEHQIYHRDLKPENILLHGKVAKVADFSMARGIHEPEPNTSYVSTRWYRAPEILMMSKTYSSPVDLFAVGCIYSEIHTGLPLFPGFDEVDQLRLIFAAVGTPQSQGWQEGIVLLNKGYRVIQWPTQSTSLGELTSMKGEAVNLLSGLLRLDPAKRVTADQALAHSVFDDRNPSPTNTAMTPACATKKMLPIPVTISPKSDLHFPSLGLLDC